MQYNILSNTNLNKLILAVNEAQYQGWTVTGGLATVRFPNESLIMQAMVRTDVERDIRNINPN